MPSSFAYAMVVSLKPLRAVMVGTSIWTKAAR
jgi:hypothetical protein